jgi:hypothetical protein
MNRDPVRQAIAIGKSLKADLQLGIDVNDKIYAHYPYCERVDGHLLIGFCGRGDTAEAACLDLLHETFGTIKNSNKSYHGQDNFTVNFTRLP